MALKLKCPCGERLVAPESAIGKRGKCSKCGRSFVIPDPKAPRAKTAKAATPTSPSAAKAQAAAESKVATHAKSAEPDLDDLPELDSGIADPVSELPNLGGLDSGGGLSADMGSELDDFLNEEVTNPFQSPTASATAPPAKSASVTAPDKMNTLANGIKLVFWGTALIIIAWTTAAIGALLHPFVAIAGLGLLVLSALLSTVGRVVCLGGPKDIAGRWLLIAAVICDLGNLALTVSVIAGVVGPYGNLLSPLLGLSTFILFLLFIRAVADSIDQPDLAQDAKAVLVFLACTFVTIIGVPFIAMISSLFLIPVVLVLIVMGAIAFSKYLNVLQFTAEAVRRF